MMGFSDQSQMAAIDAAIRCIRFNERPRAAERELLVLQLEFVKGRIAKARETKRERESDRGIVEEAIANIEKLLSVCAGGDVKEAVKRWLAEKKRGGAA